ncbi:hypothetical protein ACMAZF_12455 [Psychrobium sp. nBUS_13]|uniref:hypothetical protein n=1 Tax=Psychrobium sp. nBUS_13 TaxID=3395319 RepID=UPI003EBE6995
MRTYKAKTIDLLVYFYYQKQSLNSPLKMAITPTDKVKPQQWMIINGNKNTPPNDLCK